ncbi:ubiquitin carboxyl-terminal hydrolase 8-like [Vigna angularis]|uniref:ubiquitin carboxyl-terminal hydrolase 8-like n=1 Tax=Phaseolus angularis TaxID=3914 RepID=UPI0022B53700|nr:ubiquitin carboxyl-terminal hydrolase 8-like [Vigna angularis]
MDCASEDSSDNSQRPHSHKDQRVYFVPHRWWKDAQDSMPADSDKKKGIAYASFPGSSYAGPMKIINTIFSSDLAFSLRREEDLQHSPRTFPFCPRTSDMHSSFVIFINF